MIDETDNKSMPELLAPLIARFGYQFMWPHCRFSLPEGWMPIFSRLCQQIDDVLPPEKRMTEFFHWRQMKEKRGTGRFYYGFGLDPEEIFRPIISAAEEATETTCAECGKPAELRSMDGGPLLTLCEQCLNEWASKEK